MGPAKPARRLTAPSSPSTKAPASPRCSAEMTGSASILASVSPAMNLPRRGAVLNAALSLISNLACSARKPTDAAGRAIPLLTKPQSDREIVARERDTADMTELLSLSSGLDLAERGPGGGALCDRSSCVRALPCAPAEPPADRHATARQ